MEEFMKSTKSKAFVISKVVDFEDFLDMIIWKNHIERSSLFEKDFSPLL